MPDAWLKNHLKHLIFRLLRPGLVDVNTRLDRIERALGSETHGTGLAGSAPAASNAEAEAPTGAIWRGGLSGAAITPIGRPDIAATKKYHEELLFWVTLVHSPETVAGFPGTFEQTYGSWQRGRIDELRSFLELDEPAFAEWCAARTAIEIGPGPYPSIAKARWARAVAVDPLADGYAAERLIPERAARVMFLSSPGEAVPLPSQCADLVVMENCLDHVDDPAATLGESHRLLKPGGLLWLLVDLMDYTDQMHPNPFNEQRIGACLAQAGFETVRDRTSDHKSHPQAYGEYRALLRRPDLQSPPPTITVTAAHDEVKAGA